MAASRSALSDRRDKYEMLFKVGQGTFGEVWKARVKESGREVAIKEIKLVLGKDGVGISAIDEIRLMQELEHPNVLALHEVFAAREGTLSLVIDFLQTDLEKIIRAKDVSSKSYVPMPANEIKAYLKMFLQGVSFCHDNFVLHRDLKPANLLIGADGVLKLCDFGLARTYGSPNAKYSPQAITLWYRPMELLLGAQQYGPACDMWGVGCIFGEMLLRAPLFATAQGASDLQQMQRIMELMGSPTDTSWPGMEHLPVTIKFKHKDAVPLAAVFTGASSSSIDLMSKLLRFDPRERITASQALEHAYITAGEPEAPHATIAQRVLHLVAHSDPQQPDAAPKSHPGTGHEGRGGTAGVKRKAADSPAHG